VFLYQEQVLSSSSTQPDGRPLQETPLIIGVMTSWQRQQAIELGHGQAVLMDSTFGTNKYSVSNFSAVLHIFSCRPHGGAGGGMHSEQFSQLDYGVIDSDFVLHRMNPGSMLF